MADWEADQRPFSECLKSWHRLHDWSRERAAAELRVSLGMYNQWCSNKKSSREATLRRMMTLVDEREAVKSELTTRVQLAVGRALEDP